MKGGLKSTPAKVPIIKSSLRKAPIAEQWEKLAKKGRAQKRIRKSSIVSHARLHSSSYPPNPGLHQRILKKVAENRTRAMEETKSREGGRVVADVGSTSSPVRIISFLERSENQQTPLVNTYATRNQLKQVLLAKAAADRDKTCVNSVEAYCKENSKGLRAKPRIKKGNDHGKGNDHSLFAASSRSEREAMGRLLAM